MTTTRIDFLFLSLNHMVSDYAEDDLWMNLQIALQLLPTAELETLERRYHPSSCTANRLIWGAITEVLQYRDENGLYHV